MRWRRTFLLEVFERLKQLGLSTCPVCGSDKLWPHRFPSVVLVGGFPPKISNVPHLETNIEYLVHIGCQVCGYALMFNSEQFRTGDEDILISGLTEEQELELEQKKPL